MNNFKYVTITCQGSNKIAEAVQNGTKIKIIGLVGITSEQTKTTAMQAMAGLYCDPVQAASVAAGTWRIPVEPLGDTLACYFRDDYIYVGFGYIAASFLTTKVYKELAILCRPDVEGEENKLYTFLVLQPTYPLYLNSVEEETTTSLNFKIYFPNASSIFTL